MNPDDGEGETAERIEKLQVEIREAKQRAKEAKARDEAIKRQQKKVVLAFRSLHRNLLVEL